MTTPSGRELSAAADAVRRGDLVVLPTDTVYGVATRPDDPAATARLFEAKRRPRDLELPILVASLVQAETVGDLHEDALVLAERFWPGALTIVVRRSPASRGWDLGGNPETVGVRVPNSPTALSLLEWTGPLAVTSANLSGSPTPASCSEIAEIFGDSVALALCADDEPEGTSSTVVDCTVSSPVVLRSGAIEEAQIMQALS